MKHHVMRKPHLTLLAAVTLLLAACGTSEVDPTTSSSSLDATSADGSPSGEAADPGRYVAEMDTLFADLLDRESRHDSTYNEEFFAGRTNDSVAQGEVGLTEEEQLDYMRGYLTGLSDINFEHVDLLALVNPPEEFVDAHHAYVLARRRLGEAINAEFDAFMAGLSDPNVEPPPQIAQLELEQKETCRNLKDLVAEAGHALNIGCGAPP
jgi:hypothetical protein